MTEPSFTQLVAQVLTEADAPLSLKEILVQVHRMRPVDTRNPKSTIRNAINNLELASSLGGRPAYYTWWPRHLADNAFRQPLAASDLAAGTLVMNREVRMALWPDFFGGSKRSTGHVTLRLAGGPELQTRIAHLVSGQAVWGLAATPELANWYRRHNATLDDELVVQTLDADARRYALTLVHRAERQEKEIVARNHALADATEAALQTATKGLSLHSLSPRLVARDAYHHPLPPDPLQDALRTDLRFVMTKYDIHLTARWINALERERGVPPDSLESPRPRGDRRRARSEQARQAWGTYLFARGMDYLWGGWNLDAEAYYRESLRLDPGHADAWVHLGNRRFEKEHLVEALHDYERGQAAAQARTIGDPAHYTAPFWLDLDSRPFMRALHGQGLCLWQLERVDEARHIFAWMLELNPNDNQGVRFLLHDLDEGLSWEESEARDRERFP